MSRQQIVDTYLATIGKSCELISAYERSVLSSFADELMQLIAQQNQQAVQKALDSFERNMNQITPEMIGQETIWTCQAVYKVLELTRAALAAAQALKNTKEKQ